MSNQYKKTYYKVQPEGDRSYCVFSIQDIGEGVKDWLSGANIGEVVLKVSTIELTEEEFEAMPEYDG